MKCVAKMARFKRPSPAFNLLGRALFASMWLVLLLGTRGAHAVDYSLPAATGSGPFASCSGSGSTYNCSGAVTLADNDAVVFSSNMTLAITGAFTAGLRPAAAY